MLFSADKADRAVNFFERGFGIIDWSGGLASPRALADTRAARRSTLSEVLALDASGFIYALVDTRIDDSILSVRYIGMTRKTLARRLAVHLSEARNSTAPYHRLRWIRSVLDAGLIPGIIPLASVHESELATREIAMIAHYRQLGADLTNGTAGGEGFFQLSAEARAKVAAASRGRSLSDAARAKVSRANKGRVRSEQERKRISESLTGRFVSDETRKKIANSLCGHGVSDETRAKIGDSGKGRIVTQEQRERKRQQMKGRTFSDESRAKMSRAMIGNTNAPKVTDEHRRARKAAWQRAYMQRKREAANLI